MKLQLKVRGLLDLVSVEKGEIGFMTCAVYDTAWVSMVAKETNTGKIWLFPECFRYVIDSQLPDGGWPAYAAPVDGILNTAASLLSLKVHQASPYQIAEYSPADLKHRVASATQSLRGQLQTWDVEEAIHVGFELLVPTLLKLLEEQGVSFKFPGSGLLANLNESRLSQVKPAYLYSETKLSALHLLEAFVGKLDYDKVRHHKTYGSYMASIASTAASLVYSSSWDVESEEYLTWVLAAGEGQGSGGVPSAFPSTIYEVTWVLTTLLEGGFSVEDIGEPRATHFATFLRKSLDEGNGRTGFASSVTVDVDDTAKTLLALSLLGHPAPHQGLLDGFETETHFKTYDKERNSSFTANCNVLVALLSQPKVWTLSPQIIKIVWFLSKEWGKCEGFISDKWNVSKFYPSMLMAEAFSKLLKVWDRGDLPNIPKTLIADEIIVSLYQVLVRTLMTQDSNGSWGTSSCREANAYATLTISKASILPFLGPIEAHIGSAIEAAQAYLLSTNETTPSYLWVEKVTYGSAVLTKAYVLAALNASSKPHSTLSFKVTSLVTIPRVDIEQLSHICFGSQLFDPPEAWKLQAAFIEGSLFGPYLGRLASENSPRKQKYGALVAFPFVWVACNYMGCNSLSTSSLRQGMRASLQSSGAASGNSKQESPVAADIIESANEACTRVLGIAIPMASTTIPHHPINPLSYGFTTNLPGPFLRETTTSSDSFSGLVPSVQDCIPSRAPRLDRRFSC